MEKLFEMSGENPIWIVVIVLGIVCYFVSKFFKNNNEQDNGDNKKGEKNNIKSTQLSDKTVVPSGYYRYQKDNQIVIERTAEQKRVLDEYFIVRNYKTTTCNSSLKKTANLLKTVSNVLLWPGVVLGIVGLSANILPLGVAGLVAAAGGIGCIVGNNVLSKKFEDSIKVKVAPQQLLTDEEYEKLVDAKIEEMDIAQLGLDKLGLDPDQVKEINPIVIRDKVINDDSLTVRNKKDNTIHSSTQHVTYLYFTDEQLFVYKIQFDMCCNMQYEWASEFFYKDICDISTHTSRNVLQIDDFKFEYSTVTFNIIASNSKIGFVLDGNNENIGSIQAMKHKIREKKAQ